MFAPPPMKLMPLALIDEPAVAMRIAMDDEDLAQLARSIAAVGLLHPIAVKRVADRYEVIAGHRRYIACRNLGRAEIEARDYTGMEVDKEIIKAHENLCQAPLKDGEVVEWLATMRETFDYDLAQMMAVTGKPESWIADRLSIFRGDKRIYDALIAGDLKLRQCIVLNKFPSDYIKMYMEQAIASGCSGKVIEGWLRDFKLQNLPEHVADAPEPITTSSELPGISALDPCVLCLERHSVWAMIMVWVHKDCLTTVVKALKGGE